MSGNDDFEKNSSNNKDVENNEQIKTEMYSNLPQAHNATALHYKQ